MELNELLIESGRLVGGRMEGSYDTTNRDFGGAGNASGGNGGNLRRGIAELEEASRYLAGHERQIKVHRPSMDEFEQLGQHQQQIIGYRMPIVQPSDEGADFNQANMEGYLRANQEKVIQKLVEEAGMIADRTAMNMHKSWASREWVSSRKAFMENLGYRSYNVQRESHALVLAAESGHAAPSAGVATPRQAPLASSQLRDPYLAAHAKFIRGMNEGDMRKTKDARPCKELLDNALAALDRSDPDELGYRTLIRALSFATGENTQNAAPRPCGAYAPLSFEGDISADIVSEKRRELSTGMRLFYERQFEEFMRNQIHVGVSSGQISLPLTSAGDNRRQIIKAFVFNLYRTARLPESCNYFTYEDTPLSAGGEKPLVHVWPLVYFCLRIGALDIARDELERCASNGLRDIDASAIILISALFKALQASSRATSEQSPQFQEAVSECRAKYQQLKRDSRCDPYKLCVLNLLSGADPAGIFIPDSSLEDFLWGQLWSITAAAITSSRAPVQIPYGLTPGVTTAVKKYTEEDLYRSIIDFGGSSYFDPKHSVPFKYAMILMACQQYGEAVLYLWNANKPVAAVHIAALLVRYGLLLPHASLMQASPSFRSALATLSEMTPCALLKLWVQQYVDDGCADIAVDYLATLNLHWVSSVHGMLQSSLEETARLRSQQAIGEVLEHLITSCRRDQLDLVIGRASDGDAQQMFRSGGRLDSYLPSGDVDLLLSRSAYIKASRDMDPSSAVFLYTLAGRFADVLEILNLQLTSLLANNTSNAEMVDLAKQFYETHVSKGEGRVLSQLQMEGRLDVARTLEFLLNICAVRTSYASKNYRDAIKTLDSLSIVPKDNNEVSRCYDRLVSLDRSLFQLYDVILLDAMSCIFEVYKALKVNFAADVILTDRGSGLADMRARADAILSLVNLIGARLRFSETRERLVQINQQLLRL